MKILARFYLLALFISLGSFLAFSQKPNNPKSQPKNTITAKENASKIAPVQNRVFKHQEKINVSYDKFENKTSVNLNMPLSATRETIYQPSPISLFASFNYSGQTLTSAPKEMSFMVIKNIPPSLEGSFPRQPDILNFIFLFDSSRFTYKGISVRSFEKPFVGQPYLRDSFFATFSYKEFLRLVNSNEVEFKVGYVEMKLNENHLEALRDLASLMNPNAQRQSTNIASSNQGTVNNLELKALKDKVSIQIKNLSKYIPLFGAVAKEIEDNEKSIRAGSASRQVVDKNERNKQVVIESLRNFQTGITNLGKELLSKPSLKNNQTQVQEMLNFMDSAQKQAETGKFIESDKTLSLVMERLTDILTTMP